MHNRSSTTVCMLAAIVSLLLAPTARAADFPSVDQLPARPELPDPLVLLSGERVRTKEQWFKQRAPELKELFQHYMYGYLPAVPAKVECKVEREDKAAFDGKATIREVSIALGPADWPKFQLQLIVPNQRERRRPVPVFLGLSFTNNPNILKSPPSWPVDLLLERGYALATIKHNNVSPDLAAAKDALFLRFGNRGTERGPQDWATIAAWAWGLHRAVDYLATDPDIDQARIAVLGHSRLGKAALVAAAFDTRIALAIPHQAGCGGSAPSRGKSGESVKQINDRFPHWFNGTFKEFNDRPDRLPFDQHCLVALVAPRPVLFSNAEEDTWANPAGQFQVLQAADPVYRFLGAGGLDARQIPEAGKLLDSTLGYFIRPGKHSTTRDDWRTFLAFADKHFAQPPR